MIEYTPLEELNEMIAKGWGDVPQEQVPDCWRELPGPDHTRRPPVKPKTPWALKHDLRREEFLVESGLVNVSRFPKRSRA